MTKSKLLAALALAASITLGWPVLAQTMAPAPGASAGLPTTVVKALQEALNKQGIAVKVDGVLGEGTREAIKKYQSQHHLPVTGEPDKATLDKLGVAAQQGAMPQGGRAPSGAGMAMQGGGMPMMGMMNMMGQGGMGMGGMGMHDMGNDRIEGRIAFLRAEMKITEAQTGPWNAFAEAVRTNAKTLGEMRSSMMPMQSEAQSQTFVQRLDQQERWYSARLDGLRALKKAFAPLYEALSAEQKKTADELVPPHVGMHAGMGMGGGMGMPMGGGMMPMGSAPK